MDLRTGLDVLLKREYLVPAGDRTLERSNYSHRVLYSSIPRSAHTLYLCVLCGSENKQRLFPYTALTDWFYNGEGLFTVRYGLDLITELNLVLRGLVCSLDGGLCPASSRRLSGP